MKLLATAFFLTLFLPSIAQDKSLEDSVLTIFCKCFTLSSAKFEDPLENEFLDSCLETSGKGIEKELQKKLGYDSSHPDNNLAYKFGQELMTKNGAKLIFQCDAFFLLMDKVLMDRFRKENKDSATLRIQTTSELIKDNPKDVEAYTLRILSYLQLSKFTEARADIEKLISMHNGKYPQAFIFRGILLYLIGEYSEAIADFERVKTLNPDLGTTIDLFITLAKKKQLLASAEKN